MKRLLFRGKDYPIGFDPICNVSIVGAGHIVKMFCKMELMTHPPLGVEPTLDDGAHDNDGRVNWFHVIKGSIP
jgi:hypothetical protein